MPNGSEYVIERSQIWKIRHRVLQLAGWAVAKGAEPGGREQHWWDEAVEILDRVEGRPLGCLCGPQEARDAARWREVEKELHRLRVGELPDEGFDARLTDRIFELENQQNPGCGCPCCAVAEIRNQEAREKSSPPEWVRKLAELPDELQDFLFALRDLGEWCSRGARTPSGQACGDHLHHPGASCPTCCGTGHPISQTKSEDDEDSERRDRQATGAGHPRESEDRPLPPLLDPDGDPYDIPTEEDQLRHVAGRLQRMSGYLLSAANTLTTSDRPETVIEDTWERLRGDLQTAMHLWPKEVELRKNGQKWEQLVEAFRFRQGRLVLGPREEYLWTAFHRIADPDELEED